MQETAGRPAAWRILLVLRPQREGVLARDAIATRITSILWDRPESVLQLARSTTSPRETDQHASGRSRAISGPGWAACRCASRSALAGASACPHWPPRRVRP